jgi:hypothetical protein
MEKKGKGRALARADRPPLLKLGNFRPGPRVALPLRELPDPGGRVPVDPIVLDRELDQVPDFLQEIVRCSWRACPLRHHFLDMAPSKIADLAMAEVLIANVTLDREPRGMSR